MSENQTKRKSVMVSILSLSLLTVMAGAAVAPALGVIKEYFADDNQLFVQMIISIPAVFIVITNLLFPKLCKVFCSKTLVLIGLLLYTFGGCLAGVFNNIAWVLAARALVGVGVGIIMPLSTGLLSFYYPPEEQAKLMGYSSAMNQMGGVVATLLSGILAGISWRAAFLVYLLGLFSIVLCFIFLPNDQISCPQPFSEKKKAKGDVFKNNYYFVLAMFLLMTTFFIYPANFAMQVQADGLIPQKYVAVIMAGMDLIAFFGGLLFVSAKRLFKNYTKFLAPVLFLAGYLLLAAVGGWFGTLLGSACIGFANGAGIPFIISTASQRAGKDAVTTVMPLISAALYLAQFVCPFIMSAVGGVCGGVSHLPYWTAAAFAVLFAVCSALIPNDESKKPVF